MSTTNTLDQIDADFDEFLPFDYGNDRDVSWYVEQLQTTHPEWANSPHQSVRDMFEYWGTEYDDEMGTRFYRMAREDPLAVEEGRQPNAFYGVEPHQAIHRFVNQINEAAKRGQAEKRLNLLAGPVGAGKSDFDKQLRTYFQDWTRRGDHDFESEGGTMYTFKWVNLCDKIDDQISYLDEDMSRLHQDPLVLIPPEIRGEYLADINEAFKTKSYVLDLNEQVQQQTGEGLDDPEQLHNALLSVQRADDDEALDVVHAVQEHVSEALGEDVDLVSGLSEFEPAYTIYNDQRMDPTSQFYFDTLYEEYGSWSDVVDNHIEVVQFWADENKRQGIETFEPKDPKNQDESELTGGIDYSKIAQYGEDDPRAWDYAGAFARANRGIFSGEELLRLDRSHRDTFLHATQEQTIKPAKTPRMDVSELIVGRTNVPWLEKVEGDDEENAFEDRTTRTYWPYPLQYGQEKKIYQKFLDHSDINAHIEPHTLELAGLFTVLTRISDPDKVHSASEISDIVDKAKLYNGEEVDIAKEADPKKLKKEADDSLDYPEGMTGVGPRPIISVIEEAIQDNEYEGKDYLNPDAFLEYVGDHISEFGSIPESLEDPEELNRLIEMVEDEYHALAREDLRNALAYDKKSLRDQAEKYLDHAQAYVMDAKVKDDDKGLIDPSETFLEQVEDHLKQSRGTRDEFRQTLSNWYGRESRRKDEVDVLENERLRRALEGKLWEDTKHNINFSGLLISAGDDIDDDEKNAWIDALEETGYSRPGAEELIKKVGVDVVKAEMEEERA